MSIIAKAESYAWYHHNAINQVRKYTGEPYVAHLKEVAGLVWEHFQDEDTIAAAWLHDILEDTPVTRTDLLLSFGTRITAMVEALTDRFDSSYGNRKTRKALYCEQIAQAGAEVHTIKLADLISNTCDIALHDPDFARVYLREKKDLLEVLDKGDKGLYALAQDTWQNAMNTLRSKT